jgi:hypothetical protein
MFLLAAYGFAAMKCKCTVFMEKEQQFCHLHAIKSCRNSVFLQRLFSLTALVWQITEKNSIFAVLEWIF